MEFEELKREVIKDNKNGGTKEENRSSSLNCEQATSVDGEEQNTLDSTIENVASMEATQQRASVIEGLTAKEENIYKRIMEPGRSGRTRTIRTITLNRLKKKKKGNQHCVM